jgi:hypothetical protein
MIILKIRMLKMLIISSYYLIREKYKMKQKKLLIMKENWNLNYSSKLFKKKNMNIKKFLMKIKLNLPKILIKVVIIS